MNRVKSEAYAFKMARISKYLYNAPPEKLKQKNKFFENRMIQATLGTRDYFGGRALLAGDVVK